MLDQLTPLIAWFHAAATWFMIGLIWFVQIVHYPLMREVPPESTTRYARTHQRRTTAVVAPVMLVEVGTALLLVLAAHREHAREVWAWIGVACLAVIWASTFAVQVRLHATLASQFDGSVLRRLVASNWLRTAAWSLRGVVAVMLVP